MRAATGRIAFVTGRAVSAEIAEGSHARARASPASTASARASTFHGDVRDPDEVERRSRASSHATGRIDVLVNCAGVREIGDVYTMAADEWDNVIAINLSGTFYCCQAAARTCARAAAGRSSTSRRSAG